MLTAKELINQLINEDSYDDIEFNFQTNPLFNAKVLRYLEQKLDSLKIRLPFQKQPEHISDLMKNKLLEGWCWQTTETTILFLDDDAYIERGHIILYPCTYYWHSWICFKFKGKTYVFDSCLQKLIPKDLYYKIFRVLDDSRPDITTVTAKEVKESFFHKLSINNNTSYVTSHIYGNDDVHSAMYRNSTRYTVKLENKNIISMLAEFNSNC